MKAGGFSGVYNGVLATALGAAPGAAMFFSAYEGMKPRLQALNGGKEHPLQHSFAASCGEVAACLVRVPTAVVTQRMQVSPNPSPNPNQFEDAEYEINANANPFAPPKGVIPDPTFSMSPKHLKCLPKDSIPWPEPEGSSGASAACSAHPGCAGLEGGTRWAPRR